MTTFRIKKSAMAKNPRHDTGHYTMDHDDIVVHVIQKMRKLGCRLVHYNESNFPHSDEPTDTVMKFEAK